MAQNQAPPKADDLDVADIVAAVTTEFLQSLDPTKHYTDAELKAGLLAKTKQEIELQNAVRNSKKLETPTTLFPYQIAKIVQINHHFKRVAYIESNMNDSAELRLYQESGPDAGLYTADALVMRKLLRTFDCTIIKQKLLECLDIIEEDVDIALRTQEENLVPVQNGIFDYDTKTLMPFSPDYVFVTKLRTDYNPNAQNVIIHNPDDGTDWDIESWFDTLTDDPLIKDLLWKTIGAALRPFHDWKMSVMYYGYKGNNGKSTLCALIQNIVGKQSCASIQLNQFSKSFAIEQLIRASLILTDENDVGSYIDNTAALKAVCTNDTLYIERKYKQNIEYSFNGFMIQSVNALPKFRDKTSSLYRRFIIIPFENSFTGHERTYIKDDYLKRAEVREYVMYKMLNVDFDTLPEPPACKVMKADMELSNNPIQQFVEEIIPQTAWPALPYRYMYDLYRAWFVETNPNGKVENYSTFTMTIFQLSSEDRIPGFKPLTQKRNFFHSSRIAGISEPLSLRYNLVNWLNNTYSGNTVNRTILQGPNLPATYEGIVRL